MLVPTIRSTGISLSSRTLSTPRWARPRAAPPPSASPTLNPSNMAPSPLTRSSSPRPKYSRLSPEGHSRGPSGPGHRPGAAPERRPPARRVLTGPPQRACRAVGVAGPAKSPAERDQVHVRNQVAGGGYEPGQNGVARGRGRPGGDPPHSPGHPMDVRVDGERSVAAGEQENAAGRLVPDAPEARQVPPRFLRGHSSQDVQVEAAPLLTHASQHLLDDPALDVGQAPAPDRFLDPGGIRFHDRFPGRERLAQAAEGTVAVQVVGVLRQDGQDQLVQRRQGASETRPAERRLKPVEASRNAATQAAVAQRRSPGATPSAGCLVTDAGAPCHPASWTGVVEDRKSTRLNSS